jgi:hypothetical protein
LMLLEADLRFGSRRGHQQQKSVILDLLLVVS